MNEKRPENWKPYYESFGPMKPENPDLCRWFHLELDSHCNLRCALCFPGNMENYSNTHGRMSLELVEMIYDKIQAENPKAVIRPYGNSEPFLYPWLPEAIDGANRRGLLFEIATNLNYTQRLEETMAAKPAYILVGISGWKQETYVKSHCGGDIGKVRQNLIKIASLKSKYNTRVLLNYQIYIDNQGPEMEEAKKFANELGFEWAPSPGRTISLENALVYLRWKEKFTTGSVPKLGKCSKGFDWDSILPEVPTKNYREQVPRLIFSPEWARTFYAKWPIPQECPIKNIGCYIRWDGNITFCPIESDRRLDIGNYLEMTASQINEARKEHPICRECLRYRFNLYTNLVDYKRWGCE